MGKDISRRDFLKGIGAGSVGLALAGVLGACSDGGSGSGVLSGAASGASSGTEAAVSGQSSGAAVSGQTSTAAASIFKAGTYTSTQSTPYATVEIVCTFSASALTDVSFNVVKTSDSDYFTPMASSLKDYCSRIVEKGTPNGVDGVSSATLCSEAIKAGVNDCTAQALGLSLAGAVTGAAVLNPQVEDFDTFSGSLDAVFSPIKLGAMTLPNRVCKSAGSSPWANDQKDKIPVAAAVYGRMAENGVSLNILVSSLVRSIGLTPSAKMNSDEEFEEGWQTVKPLFDAVHKAGGKIGYQVYYGSGNPVVADSAINDEPVEKIDANMEGLAIVARRARQVGIDCIEIKGASADVLNGFLSRRVNRREDEYGPQSIENRTRLFCRMIRTIKEAAGADFPVGALINGVEENDAALGDNELFLTIEETKAIAKKLEAAGADWLQIRVGAAGQEMNIWAPDVQHLAPGADGLTGYGTFFDYTSHYGGMTDGSRSGFAAFLPLVKAIKEAVSIPVGCAADTDLRLGPDYLNNAIKNGELDLIFMNRPLNCDPMLMKKMQAGRREDVVPCMKCMHCHDSVATNNVLKTACRMNPTVSNAFTKNMAEGLDPTPATDKKKVMVIGGGPAGMEAARVAAQRGHTVTLYERQSRLGGLIPFAQGVKGNHERFSDYLAYITHQLDKEGVTVKLGVTVDAAMVKSENPDAVIVAVGGKRENRYSSPIVYTPEAAFGATTLGERVVILGVNVQAVDFAAYLVNQGKKVTMVNPGAVSEVDKGQSGWFQIYMKPYLYAKGVKIWHNAAVRSVNGSGVTILTDVGLEKAIACDSVVEFLDMVPNTSLAKELESAGYKVQTVGDAKEPWNIQKAVLTGNLAGRKV